MKFFYLIIAVVVVFAVSLASSEFNSHDITPHPSLLDISDRSLRASITPLIDIKTIKVPLSNWTFLSFEKYNFDETGSKPFELQSMEVSDAFDRWKSIGFLISRLSSAPRSSGDPLKLLNWRTDGNFKNATLIPIYGWNRNWSQSLNDQFYNIDMAPQFASLNPPVSSINKEVSGNGVDVKWGY